MLLFDSSGELFNNVSNFMASNIVMKILEPVLALGFVIHILLTLLITYTNWKARPQNYKYVDRSKSSSWSSRNMFILGGLIFVFLIIHVINFYWKLKFG